MIASFPKPGTDNAALLLDVLQHYPKPAYDCNSRLGLTAHSRASNLRDLGWSIESVSRTVEGRRKRQFGYRLTELPSSSFSAGDPDELLDALVAARARTRTVAA